MMQQLLVWTHSTFPRTTSILQEQVYSEDFRSSGQVLDMQDCVYTATKFVDHFFGFFFFLGCIPQKCWVRSQVRYTDLFPDGCGHALSIKVPSIAVGTRRDRAYF